MGSPSAKLRVAVIGCGAVTRANLMPVLAGHDGLSVVALVDRSRARAEELASAYGVARVDTEMDAVLDEVDAVVLATPPAHHAPATRAVAARGKHVFVEKPMAITSADARAMVDAARDAGVVLAVGLYRRLLPSVRLLRTLVATREFGRPLTIDAEEGGPYGWQLASLDGLTRSAGGGGVLIDIGSHVLDVLLHVVPGTATLSRVTDNARGGIETDCELTFTIDHDGALVTTRVELSRTRELRGSIRVTCERATLELLRGDFTQLLVHPTRPLADEDKVAPNYRLVAEWSGQGAYVGYQAFREEIDDWVRAINNRTEPMLSGASVVPVVTLIEDSYRNPEPQSEPWTDEGLAPKPGATTIEVPARRRVLVTGAGGFLGGRATEILRERYGWDAVAVVREPKSAARLARWPGEIAIGDVCSPTDMDRVVQGCDAVVHCAVGTIWPPEAARRVTVEGTKTVAEAARRAGVRRFVHISTLFVHRRDGAGTLDESTPVDPPADDDYGQAKLAAERALAGVAQQGLSTVVLRPVRIYGPFSKTFTVRPLEAISQGRFAVGGDPDVPANMVYVDNVVEAIARAVEAGDAVSGSAYLISDAEQVSLDEFFSYFASTVGRQVRRVPAMPPRGAASQPGVARRWIGGVKAIATSPELRGIVRRVLSTDPIGTLPRRLWDSSPGMQQTLLRRFGADAAVIYRPAAAEGVEQLVYTGEAARVSIDKARRDLGFEPPVSRERAMALTLAWARQARLLS
jgi:predicted dehydrogenase/nucleoside-diphosphate-sugar epimerase